MLRKFIKPEYAEKFIIGALEAMGGIIITETYRNYVDIDPLASIRNKAKVQQRKKLFNDIMKQTNLKEEIA